MLPLPASTLQPNMLSAVCQLPYHLSVAQLAHAEQTHEAPKPADTGSSIQHTSSATRIFAEVLQGLVVEALALEAL